MGSGVKNSEKLMTSFMNGRKGFLARIRSAHILRVSWYTVIKIWDKPGCYLIPSWLYDVLGILCGYLLKNHHNFLFTFSNSKNLCWKYSVCVGRRTTREKREDNEYRKILKWDRPGKIFWVADVLDLINQ